MKIVTRMGSPGPVYLLLKQFSVWIQIFYVDKVKCNIFVADDVVQLNILVTKIFILIAAHHYCVKTRDKNVNTKSI